MSAHRAPRDDADMVSLARATSWCEWRRFLRVALAFAQAGAELKVLDARLQAAGIPFEVDERRKVKERQGRILPGRARS